MTAFAAVKRHMYSCASEPNTVFDVRTWGSKLPYTKLLSEGRFVGFNFPLVHDFNITGW